MVSACVLSTAFSTGVLSFLPVSVCVTLTLSPAFKSTPSGKSTLQFPSCPTVVSTGSFTFGNVTLIVAPAVPVPVTCGSSLSTLFTVGFALVGTFSGSVGSVL